MKASEIEATVFNIQKFSTEDGPGIRTTVFMKGCPMLCPWCHNPESIHPGPELVWHAGRCLGDHGCIAICPENALYAEARGVSIDRTLCRGCGRCSEYCPSSALEIHGRRMGIEALFETLVRDENFYEQSGGGVTLSGGEPLVQLAATVALLRMLREHGIHTALDTCGAASEQAWQQVLPLTDLVLFDIKTVNPEKHLAFTGVPFERVKASAEIVAASGVDVWVRTPIIPGYTSETETVQEVARFVAATFPHCTRHTLLAFSNLCTAKYAQLDKPFALEGAPLFDETYLGQLCDAAGNAGSLQVHWTGPTAQNGTPASTTPEPKEA